MLRSWVSERLPVMLQTCLPCSLAIILLPCGLLALTTRARWVLMGVLVLFVAFYSLIGIFAAAYCVIATAALIPLGLLGGNAIAAASGSARGYLAAPMAILLGGIGILGMPSFKNAPMEQYA